MISTLSVCFKTCQLLGTTQDRNWSTPWSVVTFYPIEENEWVYTQVKSVTVTGWVNFFTMEMRDPRLLFFKEILVSGLKVNHPWWKCHFLMNCVIGRKSGRMVAFGVYASQGINFWGNETLRPPMVSASIYDALQFFELQCAFHLTENNTYSCHYACSINI